MIEDSLKGAIISTISSVNNFNLAIYFDYIEDETSAVEASITDNYVESNYSIQDHIAIKPRIYRLRGCVGEVVYQGQDLGWKEIIGDLQNHPVLKKTLDKVSNMATAVTGSKAFSNTLKVGNGISPIFSNYTSLAMNVNSQIKASVNRYKKIINNITGNGPYPARNKRQQFVAAFLTQILQQRIAVNLTDLRFAYNPFQEGQYQKIYYLQSVSAHQGDNAYITDIEVVIKEFRIATTKTTTVDKKKFGQITVDQVQKATEAINGNAKGNKTDAQQTNELLNNAEKNLKQQTKEALREHPVISNTVGAIYNGVKQIGNIAIKGQSFR